MFMDWKNQYSGNEYYQSNLQIQCNPYQATSSIFHRTRTNNFTICMEIQNSSRRRSRRVCAEPGQPQPSGGQRGWSPGDKKSRRRSRRKETYSMYIYKVLKQVSVGGHHGRGAGAGTPGPTSCVYFSSLTLDTLGPMKLALFGDFDFF